ncbi:methylation-associated defense system protein MAD7 [Sorangium sp. So ce394]|uniref:methylation-associated defense system protein MAD7 n=1 Tax=Sorangium sp. So ce394 TaxID=3133310 RepID=UPI003F5B3A0B
MKLRKPDQEFRNPKVFYPDPKNVDLDRVLINLFLYLKCDGTRPVTRGRPKKEFEKVETHRTALTKLGGVEGFAEHASMADQWLKADIFDLVNRDRPTEAIASLRPLHLEAHKIRVAKYCRDYNHADALYAMLEHDESTALSELRSYLDRGRDPATRKYDGKTPLDLETLTVLKLVEDLEDMKVSQERVAPHPPTCRGQSRVLCNDVQRLLAYQDVVPRPVMIDYLKTILGLHLGLYTLRVGRQLSGWIRDRQSHPACRACPVYGTSSEPFAECPYTMSFTVDMGSDFRTRMAQIAQEDAAAEYALLAELVKAIFAMNQLMTYAKDENERDRSLRLPEDPFGVPSILANPPADFEADFKATLKEIIRLNQEDEELTPEVRAILAAGMPSFDTLVELISHVRQKHHMTYLVQMIDKLLQKNGPFGAVVQGRSLSNPRRFHLGGRLLEVFVQLAVLQFDETGGEKRYYTEPLLVEDFLRWVEHRYGFVIAEATTPTGRRPVTLDEHRAFRENVRALKDRLREIGFYDDLSDAYNAQTVRPRYTLSRRGQGR